MVQRDSEAQGGGTVHPHQPPYGPLYNYQVQYSTIGKRYCTTWYDTTNDMEQHGERHIILSAYYNLFEQTSGKSQ